MAEPFYLRSRSSAGTSPERLGVLQRSAPSHQPTPGALFAPRHDLWRRRPRQFCASKPSRRAPIHVGKRPHARPKRRETVHTLRLASCRHTLTTAVGSDAGANTGNPTNAYWASGGQPAYFHAGECLQWPQRRFKMWAGISRTKDMSPYLVLNFVICVAGDLPIAELKKGE